MNSLTRPRILAQLSTFVTLAIPIYFIRFKVTGFTLIHFLGHTHNLPEIQRIDLTGLSLYGISRVVGHVNFKNETQKIELQNVTEAIVTTCQIDYKTLAIYLNQSENEQEFFTRFFQIFQLILVTNIAVSQSMFFDPMLEIENHHSGVQRLATMVALELGTTKTINEISKGVESNTTLDSWILNWLYYMRKRWQDIKNLNEGIIIDVTPLSIDQ